MEKVQEEKMNKKLFSLAGFISLVLSFSFMLSQSSANAAADQGVSLAPFLQEIKLAPSDTSKSYNLEVTNNAKFRQEFNLSALDFGSLDETGGIAFAGGSSNEKISKYGLAHWLQLDKKSLVLGGGQSTTVRVSVLNDQSLAPGGHYAAIIVKVNTPDSSAKNRVEIKQKLSGLVLAVKTGGERYDLHLDKITTNGNYFKLPSQVNLRFQNPGNVHVVPRGIVSLTGPGGRVISKGVINQQSSFALPETFRQFDVELMALNKDKFRLNLFGTYTLRVDYRYDGFDKYASATRRIRLVNKPVAAAAGLILIAAAGGLIGYVKLRAKKAKR